MPSYPQKYGHVQVVAVITIYIKSRRHAHYAFRISLKMAVKGCVREAIFYSATICFKKEDMGASMRRFLQQSPKIQTTVENYSYF